MAFSESPLTKNRAVNGGIVVLALIIAFNLYNGQVKTIHKLKGQIQQEHTKNNIVENVESLEQRLRAFDGVLGTKDVSMVMNNFNSLASESGLKIESLRPGTERRYREYVKTPYHIVARSLDYHTIARFIGRIESHRDVYIIDSLTIRQEILKKELVSDITISTISLNQ